jgi:apolipoprotein N-acyltransferase
MNWTLAALFGALAVILAFPTFGWAAPVLVAWTPLLVLSRVSGWRQRLLFGWLLGFATQVVIFRWIVFTAREMSGLPTIAGVGLLTAFGLWHGLMSGVFLALAEPARRAAASRRPGFGPLAIAAVYAALEWVWPILFPWGLGHAFWEVGPVMTLAAWTGVPGLSFGVMLISAALALAWAQRSTRGLRPAAVALALLMALGAGWSWHLGATPPRRVLRVGAIQMNYTLEEKRGATIERRRRLFERFVDQLESMEPDRYDLLVASEGAYPLFWDLEVDGPEAASGNTLATRATRGVQRAITSGPQAPIIVGGLRRPAGEQLRNSAVHLGPDGHLAGSYDKRILVPFGETMPLGDVFPSLRTAVRGVGDFARGEAPCRFLIAGERVACGICYESIFPGFTRETAQDDAALLVNLTIDVWFGRSTAPWFHLMVQATRAAELGVPLVRSALTGISAIVGPDGVPMALMPLGTAGVLEADVPLRDIVTPYRVVGPVFGWLCLLMSVGLLVLARRDGEDSEVAAGPRSTTTAGGVATR